jgi:hypothetical protein
VLGEGFRAGPTTTAPKLGLMAPQSRLVALVTGNVPQTRVLLPTPGWEPIRRPVRALDFTFDATGRVMYGIASTGSVIFRYDTQSEEIQFIGAPGSGPGQLMRPERIAVDAQGRIYVADGNRVVRMNDITGNGWTAFGSHGAGTGQFNSISGLAVDGKGRIYVADFFNQRVVKMDDITGAGWAEYRYGISRPHGLATDMYDRVYVALPSQGRVVRIDDITAAGRRSGRLRRRRGGHLRHRCYGRGSALSCGGPHPSAARRPARLRARLPGVGPQPGPAARRDRATLGLAAVPHLPPQPVGQRRRVPPRHHAGVPRGAASSELIGSHQRHGDTEEVRGFPLCLRASV